MSELYLVLRRRLDLVTDWVPIGETVMRDAMKRRGFSSNEKVARAVPVSTRTWERWLSRGAVPRQALDRVAYVLDLEIEDEAHQAREPIVIERETADQLLARLEAVVDRLETVTTPRTPAQAGSKRRRDEG